MATPRVTGFSVTTPMRSTIDDGFVVPQPLSLMAKQPGQLQAMLKYVLNQQNLRKNFAMTPEKSDQPIVLSDMAAAAANELIQMFITNPN